VKKLVVLIALCLVPLFGSAITAKSYIVTEMDGSVLLEKNPDEVRSIASITKLITTRSAAAYDQAELIEILPEDLKEGRMRSTPLRVGSSYTRGQLTELALVSSDNVAAIALGRTALPPFTLPPSTSIVEASGLDPKNTSSARDLAELARTLVDTDIARSSVHPMVTIGNQARRSTNPFLTKAGWVFHLSKTGFINEAGGCMVVIFETGGRLVTAVILGSSGVPARWRDLIELRRLLSKDETFEVPSRKPGTKRKHR
jgi:D-alanyl-D-alanine endopeptidase (penicillin-binding protein 7)